MLQRLPSRIPSVAFIGQLYFGLVLPLSSEGSPPGRVASHELQMTTSGEYYNSGGGGGQKGGFWPPPISKTKSSQH